MKQKRLESISSHNGVKQVPVASTDFDYGSLDEETMDAALNEPPDRERDQLALNYLTKLVMSTKIRRVQCLYISCMAAILQRDLDVVDIADYFGVSQRRVRQAVQHVTSLAQVEAEKLRAEAK